MNYDQNEKGQNLIAEYSPYVAVIGAIYGTYHFITHSNGDAEVFEAALTPVVSAIKFVIIMVLAVVLLPMLNTVLNTEKKRFWGAVAVIAIATVVTVTYVL